MRLAILFGVSWALLLVIAFIGPIAWQQREGATSASVEAIKTSPIRGSATVVQPEIDGLGGDPALEYRYTVSGRTYQGQDIGNAVVGDVLSKRRGDHVPIIYAAAMPQVSCLVGSTDCPNSAFDPAVPLSGWFTGTAPDPEDCSSTASSQTTGWARIGWRFLAMAGWPNEVYRRGVRLSLSRRTSTTARTLADIGGSLTAQPVS